MRLERGRRLGTKGAERGDIRAKLLESVGKLREVLVLQLQHRVVERVGHGPCRNRSRASRAPATKAGAVLQWPRTSAP